MSGNTKVKGMGGEAKGSKRCNARSIANRLFYEFRWPLTIATLVAFVDQITKATVVSMLPLHTSVPVIENMLNLTHIRNTGAAFGFMNTIDIPFKAAIMTLVGGAALLVILAYTVKLPPEEKVAKIGLAMITGGAIGNLIDRATVGYVVDFVDVYWLDYHFWAFNVADSAITLGVFIIIFELLRQDSHVSKTS